MFIPDKYAYKAIPKVNTDQGRRYLIEDGSKLPSVTTILDATKSGETKQALNNWRKSVGHAKAQEITNEAASRGTRLHKWLENYVKDGDTGQPGSNPNSQHSHKMAQVIIENGLSKCDEYYGTEVSLYFPDIYAGTTDLVGLYNGKLAIMDHKQSNKVKKREWIEDYFVQLCAYAEAHNEVYGTSIDQGVIFMCTKDLQYLEFVIEGEEFDHYKTAWWKRVEQYYTKFL